MTIQDDITAINQTLASIAATKAGSTTQAGLTEILTAYVNLINPIITAANGGSATISAAQVSQLSATLTLYVEQFNALTALTDALRAQVATAIADGAALTIGIANLTGAQVETIQQNPQQYVCGGYLCIVNGILAMNADQPTMLSLAAGIGNDLATDINNAWADLNSGVTPAVPQPSVAFDNGNALEIVIAGLQAASAAAPS